MDTTDFARALRDATDDIEPRAGFTPDVLRGGRRRRTRRRTAVAGSMALVLAAGGSITVATWSHSPPPLTSAPANPLLTAATRGDLAGDAAYLRDARTAFSKGMAVAPDVEPLIGEPRVYWAGNTPAGRVAIVVQERKPEEGTMTYVDGTVVDLRTVQRLMIGLVTGDQATLVNSTPTGLDSERTAFLFGPTDRFAVAFSGGAPLYASAEWTVGTDGHGARQWTAMTDLDGISFLAFPQPVRGGDVRVVRATDPTTAGHDQSLSTLPASLYAEGHDKQSKPIPRRTMTWPQNNALRVGGTKAPPLSKDLDVGSELQAAGYGDPLARVGVIGFEVIADLPDGGSVAGVEYVPNEQGSRLYLAIRDATGKVTQWVYGGTLDPAAALPVKVALPQDQGWLVANRDATLRYRTAPNAPWTDAGRAAALLPVNATQVEVTRDGLPATVVTL